MARKESNSAFEGSQTDDSVVILAYRDCGLEG